MHRFPWTLAAGLSCTLLPIIATAAPSPSSATSGATSGAATAAAAPQRVEVGNLVLDGIPEIPRRIVEGLARYGNTRSASLEGWDAVGRSVFVTTRFGETSQLHRVGGPGAARQQLTFYDEPVATAAACPDRNRDAVLFARDVGGAEAFQLFLADLAAGGGTRLVTDGTSRNTAAVWSRNGTRLAWASTARNGRDNDVYVFSPGVADLTGEVAPRRVLEREGSWSPLDWSPDESELLVLHYVSINESKLYRLDLTGGGLTAVDPVEGPVAYRSALWSPDGGTIWFTSDRDDEFQRLRALDVKTGSVRILDTPDWDVEGLALSPDGRMIAYTLNEDGFSRLHLHDLVVDAEMPVPDTPAGVIRGLAFNPAGGRLAFTLATARRPADVYVLRTGSTQLVRWTTSEMGGIDPDRLADATLIRYETFDRVGDTPRTIPAFYYRPEGAGPFPVLIDIHGGPESQERPTFDPFLQYIVHELGMAVVAPNVRGSSGYGKSSLLLDNGMRREDSVKDIGALLDWIGTRPDLDAERVAVIGGSYGGYMVLASMIHYNDRLRGGIDVVGISNFVTFLESTSEYRRDLRRAEYGDERDPEMRRHLEAIAPTRRAAAITRPMLIAQGRNDPRVPVGESEQMVAEIRKSGNAVWYLLANDEGHGFRKKRNRDAYNAAAAYFLETFVARPATAP